MNTAGGGRAARGEFVPQPRSSAGFSGAKVRRLPPWSSRGGGGGKVGIEAVGPGVFPPRGLFLCPSRYCGSSTDPPALHISEPVSSCSANRGRGGAARQTRNVSSPSPAAPGEREGGRGGGRGRPRGRHRAQGTAFTTRQREKRSTSSSALTHLGNLC
ncbi:unnamed protein product [Pleuronectes platessa]|uniref:Uncharacterized protein n=1 Tax=Pleuronectes platessa TaxID=8262 RepID=A0A9N7Z7N5_PLEPL|nr:unnamed protein product [Pleuronectes platessa]